MNRLLRTSLFWSLVLSDLFLISCERQRDKYDLFPLEAGNVFYYNYYERKDPPAVITSGTETWKVIDESEQGDSTKYTLERNLNALLAFSGSTVVISNRISYLEVYENNLSSAISLWGFLFERHQSVSKLELEQDDYMLRVSSSLKFKADSGLTEYHYYHGPNQITNFYLHLDSLKKIH